MEIYGSVKEVVHYGAKETAAFIRADLKQAFPGVQFSVRSEYYSGGSSVDVRWYDGPTEGRVNALLDHYRGRHFDGMTIHNGKETSFSAFIRTRRLHTLPMWEKARYEVCAKYGAAWPEIKEWPYQKKWVAEPYINWRSPEASVIVSGSYTTLAEAIYQHLRQMEG